MAMRLLLVVGMIFLVISCGKRQGQVGVLPEAGGEQVVPFEVWFPDGRGHHKGSKRPLVLLSHGSGGEYANHSWLISALSANGFIVAAVNHPLNTTRNNTDQGVISVWRRPAHISALLDHLLADERWADLIDQKQIGAAGFSSGGYTVLALAGAIYKPELMNAYCAGEGGADCELATDSGDVDFENASSSYLDERITSVFAMAPAVGPAITRESLAKIDLPVLIMAARDDELVNPDLGAADYAKAIPGAELVMLPSGGHFIFLECNIVTRIVDRFNHELDLCGTQFNIDRAATREIVSDRAVSFFKKNISPDGR